MVWSKLVLFEKNTNQDGKSNIGVKFLPNQCKYHNHDKDKKPIDQLKWGGEEFWYFNNPKNPSKIGLNGS